MELLNLLKDSGVVGAGGAGFPTYAKLSEPVETFIVNAAECEPLIDTDKFLCRNYADRIILGINVFAKHLNAKRVVIAIKGEYTAEIEALEKAISSSPMPIEIFKMKTFYPAGDEQIITWQVTGKSIPERGLPKDAGAVIDNVGTLLNASDALDGKPVTEKFLSVTGEVKEPVMLHVPIGTSLKECILKASPLIPKYAVIAGGPMMGKVVTGDDNIEAAVVTKTTGNIIVLPEDHYLIKENNLKINTMAKRAKSACIQCHMCSDLCPRHLIGHNIEPHKIMRNIWRADQITDNEQFEQIFGQAQNCCDCGACEMFSCPMGLSPRKINSHVKGLLKERGINYPKNQNPVASEAAHMRHIPTQRLIARLGLSKYASGHATKLIEFEPDTVKVPHQMHIGVRSTPVLNAGDEVHKGDILAAASDGLSVNIHVPLDGVVTEVTDMYTAISRKEMSTLS